MIRWEMLPGSRGKPSGRRVTTIASEGLENPWWTLAEPPPPELSARRETMRPKWLERRGSLLTLGLVAVRSYQIDGKRHAMWQTDRPARLYKYQPHFPKFQMDNYKCGMDKHNYRDSIVLKFINNMSHYGKQNPRTNLYIIHSTKNFIM